MESNQVDFSFLYCKWAAIIRTKAETCCSSNQVTPLVVDLTGTHWRFAY